MVNFLLKTCDDRGTNLLFICASAKTPKHEGRISSSSFCGQLVDYYLHVFSLIHSLPLDEFSLKEMRTWGRPKFHLVVFVYGVNQESYLIGRVSPRFPTPMVESSSADLLPAIKRYRTELHLEFTLWLNPRQ